MINDSLSMVHGEKPEVVYFIRSLWPKLLFPIFAEIWPEVTVSIFISHFSHFRCQYQSTKKAALKHRFILWHFFQQIFLIRKCFFENPAGIGYASIVIVSLLNIYYIVILAWGLYYLFQCFQPELPWAKCKQPWNTEHCVEDTIRKNKTLWLAANITNFTSPVTEFWEWVFTVRVASLRRHTRTHACTCTWINWSNAASVSLLRKHVWPGSFLAQHSSAVLSVFSHILS